MLDEQYFDIEVRLAKGAEEFVMPPPVRDAAVGAGHPPDKIGKTQESGRVAVLRPHVVRPEIDAVQPDAALGQKFVVHMGEYSDVGHMLADLERADDVELLSWPYFL